MSDDIESEYTPSKWGFEFHALTVDEALGAGSAGPGKSWTLLMDPVPQLHVEEARIRKDPSLVAKPGSRLWDLIEKNPLRAGRSEGWALHLRRTFRMLDRTFIRAKRVFTAIDPHVQYISKDYTYVFSSGFRFQFGHCQNRDDWENYQSNEYTHISYDELVQFEQEQFEQINTRLRTADPVLETMLKVRAMSNPLMRKTVHDNWHVTNPHWVREYFVEPYPKGRKPIVKIAYDGDEEVPHTRMYVPATIDDNPNPRFIKRYKRNLLHKPPHIQKALLYGDWYVSDGSFYSDVWDSNLHILDPFKIPPDWPVFRSMDWGYKKHGCVHWWTVDPEGNLIGIKELTFRGKSATWVAEKIRDIEESMGLWGYRGSKITGPADTQLWEKRGESGMSKAEEMSAVGVDWVPADKRSRQSNAERVYSRLGDHDDYSRPGLSFVNVCTMAIRTLPAIPVDPNNAEEPLDGGEDHWHDSICYACAYASRGRLGISEIADDDDWDDRQYEDRGDYGYGLH